MRLKFDLNVGALYIRLSDEPVARTRELDDNTLVDLDSAGGVVGVDVISAAHPWALTRLLHDYQIPAEESAQLRAYFLPIVRGGTYVLEPPAQASPELTMDRNAPVCVPA